LTAGQAAVETWHATATLPQCAAHRSPSKWAGRATGAQLRAGGMDGSPTPVPLALHPSQRCSIGCRGQSLLWSSWLRRQRRVTAGAACSRMSPSVQPAQQPGHMQRQQQLQQWQCATARLVTLWTQKPEVHSMQPLSGQAGTACHAGAARSSWRRPFSRAAAGMRPGARCTYAARHSPVTACVLPCAVRASRCHSLRGQVQRCLAS
jgi:hypothetical protein